MGGTGKNDPMLEAGVCLLAFLAGAIPFSNLVARRSRGVDLRQTGSGTVSGTALYRVAGFRALAVSGICDVAKGALGPLLLLDHPIAAAVAGGFAAGTAAEESHPPWVRCWSTRGPARCCSWRFSSRRGRSVRPASVGSSARSRSRRCSS